MAAPIGVVTVLEQASTVACRLSAARGPCCCKAWRMHGSQ